MHLERVSARTLFVAATLALSAWFLLPQLASLDTLWDQVEGASLSWVAATVVLSGLTYVGATIALLGAIPSPIPFRGAFAAQVASSFANRITPAKIGAWPPTSATSSTREYRCRSRCRRWA